MIHGLKMAMTGRGDKAVIGTDGKVAAASATLTELQNWFPQLQAAIEDNEQLWCKLGHNLKTVGATAREIYTEENPMQIMLASLQDASGKVIKPVASDDLDEERGRASGELREFNDRIRALKALHTDCVQTLKNKDYYQSKVEAMRLKESEKKKTPTDREVEKRLRNEQKLSEASSELTFKSDKLGKELDCLLGRKEQVLNLVLESFVHTQNYYFARNPMPHVLACMPTNISPKSTFAPHARGHGPGSSVFENVTNIPEDSYLPGRDQPPRPPSPVFNNGGDFIKSSSNPRECTQILDSINPNEPQKSLDERFAALQQPSAPLSNITNYSGHYETAQTFRDNGRKASGSSHHEPHPPKPFSASIHRDIECEEGASSAETFTPGHPPSQFY